MTKASLAEKFALIHEHWRPKVVAQSNGQELKLVKFKGVFPWHQHENEDELFLVWRGQMAIEFRDRRVTLEAGEFCVVPRGLEHRTMADSEAEVIVFEPVVTRNTGNVVDDTFTAPNGVTIQSCSGPCRSEFGRGRAGSNQRWGSAREFFAVAGVDARPRHQDRRRSVPARRALRPPPGEILLRQSRSGAPYLSRRRTIGATGP